MPPAATDLTTGPILSKNESVNRFDYKKEVFKNPGEVCGQITPTLGEQAL